MALTETSTQRDAGRKDGKLVSYKTRGGANVGNICGGCLGIIDLTSANVGYLRTYLPDGANSAAGVRFAGVTAEGVDNTAGANGDAECRVWKTGVFQFHFSTDNNTYGTAVQADIGKEVYLYANDAVGLSNTPPTQDVKVGRITRILAAGKKVLIRIDGYPA